MSVARLQWVGLVTLARKEVTRIFRIWAQSMVPPVITSILYFIIFGHVIGSRVGMVHGVSYIDFIMPGLVFMPMVMGAYSNVSSSFFGARFGKNIEELLVSPMSNTMIIFGYMAGGMLRGMLVSLLVAIVALCFTDVHIHSFLILVIFALLGSALFSLAGLLNGVFAKSFDDVAFFPTFVLTPLNYFGGVFYSVSMLPGIWRHVAAFDPILYLMRGFRYGFLGIETGQLLATIGISFLLVLGLFFLCHRLLSKGRGLRG